MADLLEKLPKELDRSPEAALLRKVADRKVYNIVHLNYHPKNYEGDSKDYEFSRRSMEDHWRAGYHDTVRTLRHPEVLERPASPDGVFIFDVHEHGREERPRQHDPQLPSSGEKSWARNHENFMPSRIALTSAV